jgi:cadmium resistance protein CadD (predicted permease)
VDDFVSRFAIGITAFIASNIDDTFILILLFATPGLLARHIMAGQSKQINRTKYPSILSVTAITVSNGGDDIGVFTPLFAKYNAIIDFSFLILLLLVMTGVWCMVTYYFFRHPFIASRINALSKTVTPIALILVGAYVILDSFYF